MTPTVAMARANKPPAPTPAPREAATQLAHALREPAEHGAERKIEIATMYSRRRPWMSPSFPYSGTVTAIAST